MCIALYTQYFPSVCENIRRLLKNINRDEKNDRLVLWNISWKLQVCNERTFKKIYNALIQIVCIYSKNRSSAKAKQNVSGFFSDPRVGIFCCFLCYETMSHWSQNSWIDWNSTALWPFHTGVWKFARFARPVLATIICVWEIWSWKKKNYQLKKKIRNKSRVTAPTLKPTDDQKPNTFFGLIIDFRF